LRKNDTSSKITLTIDDLQCLIRSRGLWSGFCSVINPNDERFFAANYRTHQQSVALVRRPSAAFARTAHEQHEPT
jgi:hypothetical protein